MSIPKKHTSDEIELTQMPTQLSINQNNMLEWYLTESSSVQTLEQLHNQECEQQRKIQELQQQNELLSDLAEQLAKAK